MAEGGQSEETGHPSMSTGAEDLSRSLLMSSQEWYEFFCQPCNVDHNYVEATSFCRNCQEYMCTKCRSAHRRFRELSAHAILDLQQMIHKPPISDEKSSSNPKPGAYSDSASTLKLKPRVSTRPIVRAIHANIKDLKIKDEARSSVIMSANILLTSDSNKGNVRLFDTVSGRQLSKIKLAYNPGQVTRISDKEAAVTIPKGQKIVLLSTDPTLSVTREICVVGECSGIAYAGDKFIVTFRQGRVDIMTISGTHIQTISTNQAGEWIFTNPRYVVASSINNTVYVSDWNEMWRSSKVVNMSIDTGTVLETYKSTNNSHYPHQIALDKHGLVYVAWVNVENGQGFVDQLTADCRKLRTLIPELASAPWSLSYDDVTKSLYVGQANKIVRVYKMS